jgi:hypothetical protein
MRILPENTPLALREGFSADVGKTNRGQCVKKHKKEEE